MKEGPAEEPEVVEPLPVAEVEEEEEIDIDHPGYADHVFNAGMNKYRVDPGIFRDEDEDW